MEGRPPFSLHGLNTIYLSELGWYRVDARGNKAGVQAEFDPPHEKLAFELTVHGEEGFDERFANPLPKIVEVLTSFQDICEVAENLPDAKKLE